MTRFALAGLVAALALPAAAQPPKGDDPVGRTLAAWEARQGRVKTARYTLTGTWESPSRTRSGKVVVLLDLARGRFRVEDDFESPIDGVPQVYQPTTTFDGREFRLGYPLDRPWRSPVGINDLDIDRRSGPLAPGVTPGRRLWPLLYAHGLVPDIEYLRGFNRPRWAYDRGDFVPAGRHPLAGRVCDVVRTEPTETEPPGLTEYWADPGRDGAILRTVALSGQTPTDRTDITWRETRAGWGVAGWTELSLSDGGRPAAGRWRYAVDEAEFDGPVADAEFTVPVLPGMRVRVVESDDRPGVILPGYRAYEIAPDGRWVEVRGRGAYTADGVEPPPRPGWGWWQWAALAGGVVVAGGGGVWAWRRRRSPARPVMPVS